MSEETQTENVVAEQAEAKTEKTAEVSAFDSIDTKDMTKEERSVFRTLRDENAKARIRALEAENKFSKAESDFATRLATREAEVRSEEATKAQKQLAITRLENAAVKEGLLDGDLVSLIDPKDIIFDDAGKMTNAKELVDAFKASKPHLFGSQATSAVAKTPKSSNEATDVKSLDKEAYEAAKRAKFKR